MKKNHNRLALFIADFLQPWIMRNIEAGELKGRLIRLSGQMKHALYDSVEPKK